MTDSPLCQVGGKFLHTPCFDDTHLSGHVMLSAAGARDGTVKGGRRRVFLCDGEKFNRKALYTLASVNDMDYVVFDVPWEALKVKCRLL